VVESRRPEQQTDARPTNREPPDQGAGGGCQDQAKSEREEKQRGSGGPQALKNALATR